MNAGKKLAMVYVAASILVAIGGYIGYARYEQQKFQESITPHVKYASLRLANAVRYETEKDTKITYKELFEKLESDVSEIDKRIIEVQTITTVKYKEITDPVLGYLKGSQELLRALTLKYRKQLSVSYASDRMNQAKDELRSSNYFVRGYAFKASEKAVEDFKKAEKEYNEATADVLSAARKMKDIHAKVVPFIRSDALTDVAIFEAIAQKYDSAKVEELASDFRNIPVYIYGYMDKYKALPGDDSLASTHLTISGVPTTNGNGSGLIDGNWNDPIGSTSESFYFWKHIRMAGFSPGATDQLVAGDYLPVNAVGGNIGVTNSTINGPIAGLKGTFIACSGSIAGKFAKQLDITLDDGNTTTGSMMTTAGSGIGAAAIATTAIVDDTPYTVCMGY